MHLHTPSDFTVLVSCNSSAPLNRLRYFSLSQGKDTRSERHSEMKAFHICNRHRGTEREVIFNWTSYKGRV